uniref:hypothetical protein n=1 Tax=Alistipes putredinis TaxID=28117 RepID=UPI003FD8E18E
MKARSVWWGLQWKLQKWQPEMQTLVMFTLRSICQVTTSRSGTTARRTRSAVRASSCRGACS